MYRGSKGSSKRTYSAAGSGRSPGRHPTLLLPPLPLLGAACSASRVCACSRRVGWAAGAGSWPSLSAQPGSTLAASLTRLHRRGEVEVVLETEVLMH